MHGDATCLIYFSEFVSLLVHLFSTHQTPFSCLFYSELHHGIIHLIILFVIFGVTQIISCYLNKDNSPDEKQTWATGNDLEDNLEDNLEAKERRQATR